MSIRIIFLIVSFTTLSVLSCIGQWTSQKLSSKRYDMCSCQVDDNLFFIAGRDITGKPTKTIDILNLTTNTWSVKQLRSAKSRPECIATGGKIYVAGGSNNLVDSQTLEILDSLGNYIQKTTLPNVIGCKMTILDNKLYMTSDGNMDIYDTNTNKWTYFKIPLDRQTSLHRENYGIVAFPNKIMIAGGTSDGNDYKQVSVFDIRINQWSTDSLSDVRYGLLGITHQNKAYFVGGQDGDFNYYKTIEIYDESNSTWSVDSLSRGHRFDMAVAIHEDKMYVAGGQVFGAADQFIDLVDVYDFTKNTWDILSLPTGRSAMTIIGAGDFVYFAGGRSDDEDATDIVDIYSLIPISADESTTLNGLSIYPNPVTETLFINASDPSIHLDIDYEIYNLAGKTQITGALHQSQSIDTKSFPKGNYLIKIRDRQNNKSFVTPFIKI